MNMETGIKQASAEREGCGILVHKRRKAVGDCKSRCRKETEAGRQMTGCLYRRQQPCAGDVTGARGHGLHPVPAAVR